LQQISLKLERVLETNVNEAQFSSKSRSQGILYVLGILKTHYISHDANEEANVKYAVEVSRIHDETWVQHKEASAVVESITKQTSYRS